LSGKLAGNVIIEPEGKNTAPAISLSVQFILERLKADREEIVFVFPAEHLIDPFEKFIDYIKIAKIAASQGRLITFGIKPTKPETGMAILKLTIRIYPNRPINVKRFHEKPDLETATRYLSKKNYFWNSGIFAFKICILLDELKRYQPEIYKRDLCKFVNA